MGIVLSRVDDRLIHGQVATSWIRSNNIEVVVVVDDKIPTDDMQVRILKMAAPSGIKVYALDCLKFIEKYRLGILDKYKVMLVFSNLDAPLKLAKNGLVLELLNVAGIRYQEGRRQIAKSLFINEEEEKTISELFQMGVKLEYRQLMSDQTEDLMKILL